jgi:hypothetical protein
MLLLLLLLLLKYHTYSSTSKGSDAKRFWATLHNHDMPFT